MVTYLDRVSFGQVAPYIQHDFGLTDIQRGALFSSFALAYALFEVPSGWLGDLFGARRMLVRIVLWWSTFTVLTGLIYPVANDVFWPFFALLTVRFLFGMGEAGAYPTITRAFYRWFPFRERGSAQGTVWMAGRLGGGITPLFVALLLYKVMAAGETVVRWRHIFWILGGIGLVWCFFFWRWYQDTPEEHKATNQGERDLIKAGLTSEAGHHGIPWKAILTSTNLWFLCLMYFCSSYGWYFNITWLPGYLAEQYGLTGEGPNILTFSFLAGAPLLFGATACLGGGLLTDWMVRRTGNLKWGRRLFGILGHGLCAVCYAFAIYAHNVWLFGLAIAFAAFWNDMTMGSTWASSIDIGQRYSGIVSGCMNTIGNLGGAAAGVMTGLILMHYSSQSHQQAAVAATTVVGFGANGDLFAPLSLVPLSQSSVQALKIAREQGWQANFLSYTLVYLLAVCFWMCFDASRPVSDSGKST
jgi:MFS family permease